MFTQCQHVTLILLAKVFGGLVALLLIQAIRVADLIPNLIHVPGTAGCYKSVVAIKLILMLLRV
jgi:hypothetical protein